MNFASIVPASEIASDKAAVSATNFCSLWPAGRQALVALAGVVTSSIVKFAINTVIAAGDAYCGAPTPTAQTIKAQLQAGGVNSLEDLAQQIAQRQAGGPGVSDFLIIDHYVLVK